MKNQSKVTTTTVASRIPLENRQWLESKYPNNNISDILKSLIQRLKDGKIIGFKVEIT